MSFRVLGVALLLSTAVATSNAYAADLGGDCCADLEERIAELEATTARKGNRKMGLTVYGQVNTAVMFWDNGREKNTYVVDNDISSTRFGFKGKAKITSDWEAGFKIEVEFQSAQSDDVNEDSGALALGGTDGDDPANDNNLRKAEWYIKSKTYGKVTVGQGDFAQSGITEIDLSGTNVIAQWDDLKFGSELSVVDNNGNVTGNTFESFTNDGNHEFNRGNRIRYDTPTFAGFVVSAAWGEDDAWDVALRYAGQFGDFKVAAGIAYGESTDETGSLSNDNDCSDATNGIGCTIQNTMGSASVIHSPTGLFVTGGYSYRDFDDQTDTGTNLTTDYEDNHWFVRGGISKKFFSLGKTAVYAEYQEYERDGAGGSAQAGVDRVEEAEIIGGGIVQKIDAAAMELYLGYRHVEVEDNRNTDYEDLDVVTTGARIKF